MPAKEDLEGHFYYPGMCDAEGGGGTDNADRRTGRGREVRGALSAGGEGREDGREREKGESEGGKRRRERRRRRRAKTRATPWAGQEGGAHPPPTPSQVSSSDRQGHRVAEGGANQGGLFIDRA